MIFHRICITSLFAYAGPHELDLRGAEPGQNIVLIMGRNGFGKTSLINCIKLLFTGITEEMRNSVQRERRPSVKQYVLGADQDWLGIMNRRAYAEGERQCAIRIEWQEERGLVAAERRWDLDKSAYQFEETLTIEAAFLDAPLIGNGYDPSVPKLADDFLQQRLPREYVPFFFFDGEQIQYLAEANRTVQREQMERLLNLSQLDVLHKELSSAMRAWRREAMNEAEEAQLLRLQAETKVLQADYAGVEKKITDIADDIEEQENLKAQLNRRLRSLRAYVRDQDEARLKERERRTQRDQEQLIAKISERLPVDAIFLANPSLVAQARLKLRRLIESDLGVESRIFNDLRQHLAEDLLDRPSHPFPLLTAKQKDFYRDKLDDLLNMLIPSVDHQGDDSWRIDVATATDTNQLLGPYDSGESIRRERIDDLLSLREANAALDKTRAELMDISALRGDDKDRFERYQTELQESDELLIDLKADARQLEERRKGLLSRINGKEAEIEQQEEKVQLADKAKEKEKLAESIGRFLQAFKARKRANKREAIEEALNRHFATLMTSHRFVEKIRVGEDFDVRYEDAAGETIGMGSISSGMKQLAATSLIWALKEVSGKPLPVVIDTPLARIDRKNQENLLRHYYPAAGEQVIILPTDSEIDAEKEAILAPYVYKRFNLINPDGEHARIEE